PLACTTSRTFLKSTKVKPVLVSMLTV
ncbi:type I phosphodiesterase / nucleotide pyrophosphatase family protein, partial [Vibrio parahaemolyticus V-223/04]